MLYVEIRIEGGLDEHWSSWFEDLAIAPAEAGTLLVGLVADQAALYGLLARLRDLTIPLRSVDSSVLPEFGGGLVWGGGSIESPAGACADRPALSGRAEFSLGICWEAGPASPVGRVRFHFAAADLSFTSVAIEHLQAKGTQVRCLGSGCLNAQSGHRFLLAVSAGGPAAGGACWRLKLWTPDGRRALYDNEPARSEDAAPITPLAAGRVVFQSTPGRITVYR
jgi:hypothetical protein